MKERFIKIIRIICGLALIGFSTMISKQAGSLSPWNVLNDGFSRVFPITIGQANTLIGIAVICIDIIAKEHLGIGTVLNAVLIGTFSDIFIGLNASLMIVPKATSVFMQIPLCLTAILISSCGAFLYMSAQMGSGPRDSLMLAITKRVPFQIGACRMIMEGFAFIAGALLGGEFGIGTFISVLCGGPCMQKISSLAGFDMKKIRNESFGETFAFIKGWIKDRK